ncbi:MAG: cystathionine beta-lyase [Gammaproteobacteria bacterium]|nr:cystathionine beta-lyase [Gammaproteobacteria bacterium]
MKQDTRLVQLGRAKADPESGANLPVHRASTILSPNLASYLARFEGDKRYETVTYGANGTQNARALADVAAAIEGGHKAVVTASGLSAVTMAISALAKHGDHLLVTDSVYGPTRRFCDEVLSRFGIATTYYDPGVGAGIETLFRDNTRLVYLEAPGSLTFEMQDIPAIVAAARRCGIMLAMDNTWATPLFFQPLAHGVDISIQAGTKYVAGHSDLVIGIITTASDALYRTIADHVMTWGDVAGPDDCYLALRGLRTMAVRMQRQYESALRVASWLAQRPEVKRVLYPPLEQDPGHALWTRDFSGGASLFGLALHTTDLDATARMVDGLTLFQIGSSWGGYESLIALNKMPLAREVIPWIETPFLLRIHIGLEDPDDLIEDLEAGLQRL